jgi:hypothetical protein
MEQLDRPAVFSTDRGHETYLESSMRQYQISKSSLAVLGAILLAGASAARADVHQIGSVNVSADHFTDISWEHFEGKVERLQFLAAGDTLDCAHISVTYRDGTTHKVFEGVLPKDSIETVTFPEGDSRMRHVDFACKARNLDGARIELSAVSDGWDAKWWARQPHVTIYEDSKVISR